MKKSKKTFFVTTPIYYPSGALHIGHLYTTTIAWVLKNYKEKNGYDVKFLTGSDEHGLKIQQKAIESKMKYQDFVDQKYQEFSNLWKLAKIDYDFFSRTTNKRHQKIVELIFYKMLEMGWIYKGKYKGLYSIQDEEYILETQAKKIDNNYFHPISGHKLEWVEEETYFFKMNQFSSWLKEYVEKNSDFIIPEIIWKELKTNFLAKGLEDLSITRITIEWGIKINKDPKHVIYVWLDALFNYISALDFDFNQPGENFKKYWLNGDEIVHVVGKEITRFHCIYWPIFLKSLDLKLPTKILSHGWIITPEGKMSKSKGNVIDPLVLLQKYDPEIIKYFFVAKMNIFKDSVFSEELLVKTYNSDLVNTIGNLISRTVSMINQNFESKNVKFNQTKNELDHNILKKIETQFSLYKKNFDHYNFDLSFLNMLELTWELNKYIDLTTPWKLKNDLKRLEEILVILLNGIYAVLVMLSVVCPDYVKQFCSILNIKNLSFDQINNFEKFNEIKINENKIIFERLNN